MARAARAPAPDRSEPAGGSGTLQAPSILPLPDMPVHYRVTARIETRAFCFECRSMMDALEKGFSLLSGRMEDVRIVDGLGCVRTVADFSALMTARSTSRTAPTATRAVA